MDKDTRDELFAEMKACVALSIDEPEMAHIQADRLLCEFLENLGQKKFVRVYRAVRKNYD